METLEFILPRIMSAEISPNNQLYGFIETWDDEEDHHINNFEIPLPDGNWVIVYQDQTLIRIINFK